MEEYSKNDGKKMKATAVASPNIAFIKYWGNYFMDGKLEDLVIPLNDSISMTLDGLYTKTTIEFSPDYKQDIIEIEGYEIKPEEAERVSKHIDILRKKAGVEYKARVYSKNNFPKGAGIASSASAFAALTVAAASALELKLDNKELSTIARRGSGSACRSMYGGFVEWVTEHEDAVEAAGGVDVNKIMLPHEYNKRSYARQIADKDYFDVRDVIAVVDSSEKKVSSKEGHKRAVHSLYASNRMQSVIRYVEKVKDAIINKDFKRLGRYAEADALDMHFVAMKSYPPIFYWEAGTMDLIKKVTSWRTEGIDAYFTIDAGPNVHILTTPEHEAEVVKRLKKLDYVKRVIKSKPGKGPHLTDEHLF
jgi:diphosphomevalonate decarboxylase